AIRGLAPRLNSLAADYAGKGVEVLLLNSSLKDGLETIKAEAQTAGLKVPVLMDSNQIIGESLGVTRSAEAFIINPKTWTVAWQGPASGAQAALDAILAGRAAPAATMASNGAAIAFPARGQ